MASAITLLVNAAVFTATRAIFAWRGLAPMTALDTASVTNTMGSALARSIGVMRPVPNLNVQLHSKAGSYAMAMDYAKTMGSAGVMKVGGPLIVVRKGALATAITRGFATERWVNVGAIKVMVATIVPIGSARCIAVEGGSVTR